MSGSCQGSESLIENCPIFTAHQRTTSGGVRCLPGCLPARFACLPGRQVRHDVTACAGAPLHRDKSPNPVMRDLLAQLVPVADCKGCRWSVGLGCSQGASI